MGWAANLALKRQAIQISPFQGGEPASERLAARSFTSSARGGSSHPEEQGYHPGRS
jgi:hypothetical protein